jgi:RNA polymerase sigma factor (sigma-70 family)
MRMLPSDGDVLATDVRPMRDDPLLIDLVTRARNGDKQAWDALVERYAPLIWSICRRHRLSGADADDVSQNVWLHLVHHLDMVREPAALAGWLVTTTRRECLRARRTAQGSHAAGYVPDVENIPDQRAKTAEQELLAAERHAALRAAFGDLSPFSQQLLALLIQDPPVPYAEISARLGISVGSIGPYRGRCLEKLRRHPAIAALINAEGQDHTTRNAAPSLADRTTRDKATSRAHRHNPVPAGRPAGDNTEWANRVAVVTAYPQS